MQTSGHSSYRVQWRAGGCHGHRVRPPQDWLGPGAMGGVVMSKDVTLLQMESTTEWGPESGDFPGRPGPAWTSIWAAYTTVFIPLSSSLYSSRALHFFLWLKQMKELEQEKDSLLAGLDVVERARDWYQNQIQNVTERQRAMGQNSQCSDFFTESSQTRLNVILPKLQEVNHCLSDLISCSGMPFTASGTLPSVSPNPQPAPPAPPQAVQRLKDQNRLLTQEVTEKSERITQLEQEKSALIKQLFEARSRSTHDSSTLDSTFI
ncbi:hypothetical protein SKAU_G00284040 [Synaphobranchus kaupii]|uniref:Suppressor APC domain containing 2 n=1 Tax=Synaphobranchus kaupii TaxID=118154 RepID=A0A9Q1IPA4_SYNKA|nr:hypothetical protein SKAU_G00284040 [Synaphobranchus kaupii]